MSVETPYDHLLEDETLAPLKRNQACLQCKKRKVKCDAVSSVWSLGLSCFSESPRNECLPDGCRDSSRPDPPVPHVSVLMLTRSGMLSDLKLDALLWFAYLRIQNPQKVQYLRGRN